MKTMANLGLLLLLGLGPVSTRLAAQPDHIFAYSMTPTETPTPTTDSIGKAESDCLGRAKSVSQTCTCFETSRSSWQLELDRALAKLQTELTGTAGAAALQQSQADWLHYQDDELSHMGSILAATPGPAAKTSAIKTALVAARARELDALLAPDK
jgi:uncharacterized protein YecT (DUF1311 family)